MIRIIKVGPYDPTYNLRRIAETLESIPNCGFGRLYYYGLDRYLRKYLYATSEKRIYLLIQLVFKDFKDLQNQLHIDYQNLEFPKQKIDFIYAELSELLTFFISDFKKEVSSVDHFFYNRKRWIEDWQERIISYSLELDGFNDNDRAIKEYLFFHFEKISKIESNPSIKPIKRTRINSFKHYLKDEDFNLFKPLHDAKLFNENNVFIGHFNEVKNEVRTIIIVYQEKGYFKQPVIPGHNYLFAIAMNLKSDNDDKQIRKNDWQLKKDIKMYYDSIIPEYTKIEP